MNHLHDEGYIKYECRRSKISSNMPETLFVEANLWRDRLYALNLIGAYSDGVGFGNLSVRVPYRREFWISCSASGHLAKLSYEHYARVTDFDIENNRVWSWGTNHASSESMSHAMLYCCDRHIQSIVHAHHAALWRDLINRVPTTDPNIQYGTPEMAFALRDLYRSSTLPKQKMLVMAGHEGGIMTFGSSLVESAGLMVDLYHSVLDK